LMLKRSNNPPGSDTNINNKPSRNGFTGIKQLIKEVSRGWH
jgi:hypothetical protein